LTTGVCIIHLIRNTFRLASKRDWDALRRDVKPIYTAINATAARDAFEQLAEQWGQRYPAIVRLWDNAWSEFIRSSTTTWRSAACSAARTQSSRSTPATGERSKRAATSPPNRRRSNASTS
jgi:transposase-like protein